MECEKRLSGDEKCGRDKRGAIDINDHPTFVVILTQSHIRRTLILEATYSYVGHSIYDLLNNRGREDV
ncbi:hypothetical protein AAHA92_06030 [Salvia divinorum]|uniref:Uncharacterized protein n=1 Tax=Salvia divinorum TaxID=28513 RepID=A0ABD1I4B6_SALDI